ncbi:hypothetical protein POVCU2_0018950 [Plasmodium ovale curtisi]|uniref:Uncharacterized protein n=1 Tax=Plasmodium ovale curtisi TaxID=864141 RepID=A0A1A8VTV4_PLAOA|nr:hypothetical protein POVCU2_0018950 [Plasmodium ovale curtisi]
MVPGKRPNELTKGVFLFVQNGTQKEKQSVGTDAANLLPGIAYLRLLHHFSTLSATFLPLPTSEGVPEEPIGIIAILPCPSHFVYFPILQVNSIMRVENIFSLYHILFNLVYENPEIVSDVDKKNSWQLWEVKHQRQIGKCQSRSGRHFALFAKCGKIKKRDVAI